MSTAVCTCYKCGYKFNYEFVWGGSLYSIRLGPYRMFRCPKCHALQAFDIMHKGPEKSLKTYGDSMQIWIGARVLALILGPTLALILFGAFSFFLFVQPIYIHILLIVLGVVWSVLYLVYLVLSTRPKRGK